MRGNDYVTVNSEFKNILKDLYKKDTCKALPNAIWKTKDRLNNLQCSYACIDGKVLEIKGLDQNGIHILWNRSRKINQSLRHIMEQSKFMIIHNDYFQQLDYHDYSLVKPYFRIKHDNNDILPYYLSEDFYIRQPSAEEEASEISDFIGRCYKDLHPSPDTVKSWTTHRVFDNNLWIWIVDKRKNIPAALGIAEFDSSVPEGSLEWIQVLPEYQGKGLGKVLVLELLSRLKGKVEFTTVSGEVDNETNPERLYRSCGFYGNDVWWLLRK